MTSIEGQPSEVDAQKVAREGVSRGAKAVRHGSGSVVHTKLCEIEGRFAKSNHGNVLVS